MALKLQRIGEESNTPTCAVSFKRWLGSAFTRRCSKSWRPHIRHPGDLERDSRVLLLDPHFQPGTRAACAIHLCISGPCASSRVFTLTKRVRPVVPSGGGGLNSAPPKKTIFTTTTTSQSALNSASPRNWTHARRLSVCCQPVVGERIRMNV